jgi:diacylglycerol kinase family enzyme
VQNVNPYTYFNRRPIELAEGAGLESGALSSVVLERASPVDMPTIIWRAFSKRARIVRHRRVSGFEGIRDLRVRSLDDRPIPLQVDGDFVGEVTEARFGLAPGSLAVIS